MMKLSEKEKNFNLYLNALAENLSISNTMFEKAVQSYNSVGNWLDEGLPSYKVTILPQGSFNLGTVIKPINEEDDYDIDLVCLINNKNLISLPKQLKQIIGNRLKEHKTYNEKLDSEGKRCWTLSYDGFHMDILPSIPKNITFDEKSNVIFSFQIQKIFILTHLKKVILSNSRNGLLRNVHNMIA